MDYLSLITLQPFSSAFAEKYDCAGEKLGSGGFGIVYAGVRKSDRVQVAVKVVDKSKVTEWYNVSIRRQLKPANIHSTAKLQYAIALKLICSGS